MSMNGLKSGPAVVNFTGIRSETGSLGEGTPSIGALQGISLGGADTIQGDNSCLRRYQVGVLRSNTEGNPAQPSLQLNYPGFWRFRWSVQPGTRAIQVNVKQVSNYATQRPTMIVRALSGVLATTQTATAASSTGWIVLGPISFTALAAGVLWVELHNNDYSIRNSPCYFDHIVAT